MLWDARFDLDQVERLADEVFGTGLQGAQLVTGLGRSARSPAGSRR